MAIQLIISILLALSILFVFHFFIYVSFINFFSIPAAAAKKFILYPSLLLTISFVLASILASRREINTIFTKAFYYITASWTGILVYLVLASALAWLFYIIYLWFNWQARLDLTAGIIFFLAGLFVIYNIWNAQNLFLNNVEVAIKDLPPEWDGKIAVQISDTHLGVLNDEYFMSRVARMVDSVSPDLILITGDYFDGTCPDLDRLAKLTNLLAARRGIYMVTGNHETFIDGKIYEAMKETKVKVLKDEIVELDGLYLAGIAYPSRDDKIDYSPLLEELKSKTPGILLYHAPVKAIIDAARQADVRLLLCGHTHQGQLFPLGIFTRMIFGKYHSGLNTEGDFNVYTSPGTGTWGPPMKSESKPEITVIKLRAKK